MTTAPATTSTSTSTTRQYDVIVWGASGFTGKLACEYIAKTYGLPSDSFKYAIAGRTESRLSVVARSMVDTAKLHNKTNSQSSVPIILGDVNDKASIDRMTSQAKAVVALAGPYSQCGEAIVMSCVASKTHYVDATGEGTFVASMYRKYGAEAKANKVKIMPCTGGLDFMPNEVAMYFIQEQCTQRKLTIKSVQYDSEIKSAGYSGGTARSIIAMVKNASPSQIYNTVCDPYSMCTSKPSQTIIDANAPKHFKIRYNKDARMYGTESIVTPSMANYMRWSNESQDYPWGRDLVVQTSQLVPSIVEAVWQIVKMWIISIVFFALSRLSGFSFMLPLPESGKATFEGSSVTKNNYYKAHCSVETEDADGVSKTMTVALNFPHELYWLTGVSTVEAALAVTKDETPATYGVMGASGMLGQAFVKRLEKQNITMKMLSITA